MRVVRGEVAYDSRVDAEVVTTLLVVVVLVAVVPLPLAEETALVRVPVNDITLSVFEASLVVNIDAFLAIVWALIIVTRSIEDVSFTPNSPLELLVLVNPVLSVSDL